MSFRSLRVLAPIVVVGAVVVLFLTATSVGATRRGTAGHGLLTHCARVVLGFGGSATPVSGSAAPGVVSRFGVFRGRRSDADALPAAAGLRTALAGSGARTYDPSAAVQLPRGAASGAVYAVPATMSDITLPAACKSLPQFGDAGAYLALRAQQTGSGPGACLISTLLETRGPSGPLLPGAAAPKPTKTSVVASTQCESEAVLVGYVGALARPLLGLGTGVSLIPDGVTEITYTLADGKQFTTPVTKNLAKPPAALSMQTTYLHLTAAKLGRLLAALLPTTVTESTTGTYPIANLIRPVSLVANIVASFSFLRTQLRLSSGASSSSGAGGSSSASNYASCSARTHRCVVVIVTTLCDDHEHCVTSRTIHRYRYVGAKPPPGTTGSETLQAAPIRARTDRLIVHPTKLTLVLNGTPQHAVGVLLSVSCFAHNSAASGVSPPLQVPVPSRTPIALPVPGHTFHACDVDALVTSHQRSSVTATITRG